MLAIASMSVMTPPGLAIEFDEDRLGLGRDGALEGADIVGLGPHHVPVEILEGVVELVDRAAIELLRGDEFVARAHQAVHGHHLRGVAGGDRQARGAAFERGDALLQHGVGRIADAGIDVAEGLQAEQRRGVVDILEHERGGLIDRRGARAGGRVRLGAGMDRERGKAWRAVGHLRSSCCRDRPVRGTGPWFIEARARVKVGQSGATASGGALRLDRIGSPPQIGAAQSFGDLADTRDAFVAVRVRSGGDGALVVDGVPGNLQAAHPGLGLVHIPGKEPGQAKGRTGRRDRRR